MVKKLITAIVAVLTITSIYAIDIQSASSSGITDEYVWQIDTTNVNVSEDMLFTYFTYDKNYDKIIALADAYYKDYKRTGEYIGHEAVPYSYKVAYEFANEQSFKTDPDWIVVHELMNNYGLTIVESTLIYEHHITIECLIYYADKEGLMDRVVLVYEQNHTPTGKLK